MARKRNVNTFVYDEFSEHKYPRWVLVHMLLAHKNDGIWNQFVQHQQLWCNHDGERVQVVAATDDELVLSNGERVSIDMVSDWERVETERLPVSISTNQVPPQCEPYEGIIHVDDWINDASGDPYARWCLNNFRWSGVLRMDWREFIEPNKLFCTFENERYRVTGASRMGDIWLTKDFEQSSGYQGRVDLAEVSDWGAEP